MKGTGNKIKFKDRATDRLTRIRYKIIQSNTETNIKNKHNFKSNIRSKKEMR